MFRGTLFGVTYYTWKSFKEACDEAVNEGKFIKVGDSYFLPKK